MIFTTTYISMSEWLFFLLFWRWRKKCQCIIKRNFCTEIHFSVRSLIFFFFFLKFCWGPRGTKLKSYPLKMYNLAMFFPVCTHMKTIMKIKIIDYLSLCSSFPGNWFSVTVLQFAFFRVSYKWNQIVYTSFFLDLFTQTKYFEVYSCHNVYLLSIPFNCWMVFQCMGILQLLYPFTWWWRFGLFPIYGYYI